MKEGERDFLDRPVEAYVEPIMADLGEVDRSAPLASADASVARRYEIVRPLGRGGMGSTFLARDRATGRLACLKSLHADVDRRILVQEFKALTKLRHPNFVELLALEGEESSALLVMEYVNGTGLRDYVRTLDPVDEHAIASLMHPIFDAVAAMHAHDVIHRDLKPDNILVAVDDRAARPVIIDLGLAVVDSYDHEMALTAAGRFIRGTPQYMALEQLTGEVLTGACDVYALGVILYELMTGHLAPFGKRPAEVFSVKQEMKTGLEVPDGWWSKRWKTLGPLVRSCTEPDRAKRPSAREVASILKARA